MSRKRRRTEPLLSAEINERLLEHRGQWAAIANGEILATAATLTEVLALTDEAVKLVVKVPLESDAFEWLEEDGG